MSNTLQRHKIFEQSFQIAFVATVVTLIITFATIILGSLLPNQLFASGGISILPRYDNGTWNVSLLTGLIIVVTYFIVYLLPALLGLPGNQRWNRRFIYAYIPITLVYLLVTVYVLPLATNRVPSLQGGFYPVVMTLAAAGSYLICSHPSVAERADRKRKQQISTQS